MKIDFLISRAGIRVAKVDVAIEGIRLVKGTTSFVAQSADSVTGSMTLTFADLTSALARPEILDQMLAGVAGVARPDFRLSAGADGGARVSGTVEVMGRRFPVSAASDVRVENNRIVVSVGHLEGVPLLGLLSARLPQFVLPLALPAGLEFTDVTLTDEGIVVHFAGSDVWLLAEPRPEPA